MTAWRSRSRRPAENNKVLEAYHAEQEVPAGFGPSALTVGNFDGVHAGHARILAQVRELAAANGWRPAVVTFHPHPTTVVAPDRVPRLLTTLAARLRLLDQLGMEAALVLPFTSELAGLGPEAFARRILVERLQARAVVVGPNFRFGHRQAGNAQTLEELGRRFGFRVSVAPPVYCRGEMVSSSHLRRLVAEGAVSRAARLLARPFALEGPVVRGHGVGARQTVPTLNLTPENELLPACGVYITSARDPDSSRRWPSVTNVGHRPTFGGGDLSVETFLLRPLEGRAPARLSLDFWLRLREERQFPSPAELRAQIFRDVLKAEKFFRRLGDRVWAFGGILARQDSSESIVKEIPS